MLDEKKMTVEDRQFVYDWYSARLECRTPEQLAKYHNDTCHEYDRISEVVQYEAPKLLGIELQKQFAAHVEGASAMKIIDLGAGTGELGVELKKCGFKYLHALDPSDCLLNIARSKNVYEKIMCEMLTHEPTVGIEDDTYDAAVSCGCFLPGHIPMECLPEIIRIVKRGGIILFTLRDPDFKMNYMNVFAKAMEAREVELLSMNLIPYRREWSIDFQMVYAYLVCMRKI